MLHDYITLTINYVCYNALCTASLSCIQWQDLLLYRQLYPKLFRLLCIRPTTSTKLRTCMVERSFTYAGLFETSSVYYIDRIDTLRLYLKTYLFNRTYTAFVSLNSSNVLWQGRI